MKKNGKLTDNSTTNQAIISAGGAIQISEKLDESTGKEMRLRKQEEKEKKRN